MRAVVAFGLALMLAGAFAGCTDSKPPPKSEKDLAMMVRNGRGAIIGEIVDYDGHVRVDVSVKVYDTQSGSLVGQTVTMYDGKFYQGELPPRQYRVWVNLKDWRDATVVVSAGMFTNFTMSYAEYGPQS